MKTPQLFSSKIVEQLLPEVVGPKYHKMAVKLAAQAGHRCELTKYPYPPRDKVPGQSVATTPLMIEPRETDANGMPLSGAAIQERLKKQGVTPKTVRLICPLVFWSRHVDLALRYRRGELIFAPWLSQGEAITLFRTLSVACGQPEQDQNVPTISRAPEIMQAISDQMGNHGVLTEVLALPEETEWDPEVWLSTLQALPSRERRLYKERFAKHLRFWPSRDAFSVLNGYWATTAHRTEDDSDRIGSPWIRRFTPAFEQALRKLSAPKAPVTTTNRA